MAANEYALGRTAAAKRRLEIQDAQFAQVSEELLDAIRLRPNDRVVELGIGPGGFGRRIMRRLKNAGVLVGVDFTQGLLDQAERNLAEISEARFQPVATDIRQLGPWINDADVVVGRTILHHLPLAEVWLGRLRGALRSGTRVGFIEPEFRALLTRVAALETERRDEMEPLRIWAEGIVRYYTVSDLSPSIGATMALALRTAGYSHVNYWWRETPINQTVLENMLLFYEEVREKYCTMGIMTNEQIDEQKRRIASLPADRLPAIWGTHCVVCVV